MQKSFTSLDIVGNAPNAPMPLKPQGYAITNIALPVKLDKKCSFVSQAWLSTGS